MQSRSPASSPTHVHQSTQPKLHWLNWLSFFPISRHPGSRYSNSSKGFLVGKPQEKKAQYTANLRTEARRGTKAGNYYKGRCTVLGKCLLDHVLYIQGKHYRTIKLAFTWTFKIYCYEFFKLSFEAFPRRPKYR